MTLPIPTPKEKGFEGSSTPCVAERTCDQAVVPSRQEILNGTVIATELIDRDYDLIKKTTPREPSRWCEKARLGAPGALFVGQSVRSARTRCSTVRGGKCGYGFPRRKANQCTVIGLDTDSDNTRVPA